MDDLPSTHFFRTTPPQQPALGSEPARSAGKFSGTGTRKVAKSTCVGVDEFEEKRRLVGGSRSIFNGGGRRNKSLGGWVKTSGSLDYCYLNCLLEVPPP